MAYCFLQRFTSCFPKVLSKTRPNPVLGPIFCTTGHLVIGLVIVIKETTGIPTPPVQEEVHVQRHIQVNYPVEYRENMNCEAAKKRAVCSHRAIPVNQYLNTVFRTWLII